MPAMLLMLETSQAFKGWLEHASHVLDIGNIPGIQGLVEGISAIKHPFHVLNAGDIPCIQGMVEDFSTRKHVSSMVLMLETSQVFKGWLKAKAS
jgi:hypothetical protein